MNILVTILEEQADVFQEMSRWLFKMVNGSVLILKGICLHCESWLVYIHDIYDIQQRKWGKGVGYNMYDHIS